MLLHLAHKRQRLGSVGRAVWKPVQLPTGADEVAFGENQGCILRQVGKAASLKEVQSMGVLAEAVTCIWGPWGRFRTNTKAGQGPPSKGNTVRG